MTDEVVEIALATDNGYVCGLVATAASIAMNASLELGLRFHVLDCGIRDDSYADIVSRVSPWHPHVAFERHYITDDMLKSLPEWHGGKAAYARIFLPSLLPDVHYLVYCDVDFLWLGDIAELWNCRCDDYALWSVHDASSETLDAESSWFSSHGLEFDRDKYFCSGLCFMNLERFRQEDYARKAIEFIEQFPDVKYPDQAALNYVLRNDTKLVDAKWQQLTGLLDDAACENPCVLHFAGDTPWKRRFVVNMITDAVLLWHRYYAKIYGITVWQSLRKFFPAWQIIYRRALWYVAGSRLTRALLCFGLRMFGKRECAKYIVDARKKLNYKMPCA